MKSLLLAGLAGTILLVPAGFGQETEPRTMDTQTTVTTQDKANQTVNENATETTSEANRTTVGTVSIGAGQAATQQGDTRLRRREPKQVVYPYDWHGNPAKISDHDLRRDLRHARRRHADVYRDID